MKILTINCGSSSLKYQVFDWDSKDVVAVGLVERIGQTGAHVRHRARGKRLNRPSDCPDFKSAFLLACSYLTDGEVGVLGSMGEIGVVGHRVSHGGRLFCKSVLVDDDVIAGLKSIQSIAPLHLPGNIAGLEAARKLMPDVPHVIVMDTAWHATLPDEAYRYAVPQAWHDEYHVRKYGFHGSSFLYCAKRAAVLLGLDQTDLNAVICHIGNGASVCAVRNGKSVDTSMGFTPQGGVMMGTRCGDLDPSVVTYMEQVAGLDPDMMERALTRESGLFGLCGLADRRDVEQAADEGDSLADLAVRMECYWLKKYIGAYVAALGRVDALVFTAAVGEMSPLIRKGCTEGLEVMGIEIDARKNEICTCREAEFDIGAEGSRTRILVIPTDEEMVIAEDAHSVAAGEEPGMDYSFASADYVNKGRARAFAQEVEARPELKSILARENR